MNKVYCPIPWNEVHINADGTYHSCGAQPNKISMTAEANIYNVYNMTVDEWMKSAHQYKARVDKVTGIPSTLCEICYNEESMGSSSKRQRELQKYSVIPFVDPDIIPTPDSYHISLGNECNLACRMCSPAFSSKVAVERIKEGTWRGSARLNWTEDEHAWNHVVNSICSSEKLKAVHLIGGEPLMNPRFDELITRLIAAGRTDIYMGFTTNGTRFDPLLVEKLNVFRHVDIGISIECMGALNDYVRQGSDTNSVLENIDLYLKHRKPGHVYVTVRIVPSALSVHTLDELLQWCVSRKVDVMSNLLVSPPHLQIQQLPQEVKEQLLKKFSKWEYSEPAPADSNPRDPTWFKQHIDNEIKSIIKSLQKPNDPKLTEELYGKLALWQWLDNPLIAKYFESTSQA